MSNETHPDFAKTTPISAADRERLSRSELPRPTEEQLSLVFYVRDGLRVAPMLEGASLVVGRSRPADLALRDSGLSRQHACFELLDGEVWVEDLGSTNGTWVNGERVNRVKVGLEDEISIGTTLVGLQRLAPSDDGSLGFVHHDRFVATLEAELQRARAFARSLALLMVRADPRAGVPPSRWVPRLRERLRPFHVAALYSATTAEVILPEATVETCRELSTALAAADSKLRCGAAIVTEGDTRSADALLERARMALRSASAGTPFRIVAGAPSPDQVEESHRDEEGPIAESPAMQKLFATIGRLSKSSIPVLIQGETGTGKEVVARTIHEGGKRRGKPMIPVNCGAIPPQLVESTLFGHERGAFTGATSRSKGVFESAEGGTVLLDEIGELPAAAQAALLRVLESKRITRVGSTEEIDIDVRVLAATHRNLEAMCDDGTFRKDLLFRLDAMAVRIPPLRARLEDLAPLFRRFVTQAAAANEVPVPGITEDAMALLRRYRWPGNVRELRNAVERATVIAQGGMIDVEDLPERVRGLESARRDIDETSEPMDGDLAALQPVLERDELNLKAEVQRFEALLIRKALDRHDWDRKPTAAALGVPLRTLAHRIQVYDIRK